MAVSSIFGSRVQRVEDPRMIAGRGEYTGDITLPGMVYATFLRSPYAHARILRIDAEKAKKQEGVVAVFTGAELRSKLSPVPCAWQIPGSDLKVPQYYPLATDRVRYAGDPVAVVLSEDPYSGYDALDLIEAEYEPLPAVTDAEEAVKEGAPLLYDGVPGNTAFRWKVNFGDTAKAFAEAEVVVTQRLVNQRLQPSAMETRGVVSKYDRATDEFTVWMTSQNPHVHRLLLSLMTGIPEHRLRVISKDVGGGFGSKIPCYGPDAVVTLLAREIGRPVKWIEDRRENFLGTSHGRDHIDYAEMAAKKDGTVTAVRVRTYANMGAWLSTAAPGVPTILFGLLLGGPYTLRNVACEVYGVLTNTVAVDAYRGAGRPEATYILERLMDMLAAETGIDPAEIRRRNFIREDAFPYAAATGLVYDSGNYSKALDEALRISDYAAFRNEQAKLREEGRLVGAGISSYVEMCGLGPSSVVRSTGFALGLWDSATVRVHPSGKVTAFIGGHPHGQGEETTFAQIVAHELGVKVADVDIVHGDTGRIPFGMGTYGSRTTPVAGAAVAVASRKIREKGAQIAAYLLDARAEDIVFENGVFTVRGNAERSKTISDVALASYGAGELEIPKGMEPGLENTTFYDPPNFTYPFGTHICMVEVDRETGRVEIRRYVAVDDCGSQINPMIVEGQIHGGVAQGIAQALYEEALYDNGNLLTASLADYGVPTASELPDIETSSTVTPSPHHPLGVKGVGEAGTIAAAPAVVNAVVDALRHMGVKHIDMPLRPDRVWSALRKKDGTAGQPER